MRFRRRSRCGGRHHSWSFLDVPCSGLRTALAEGAGHRDGPADRGRFRRRRGRNRPPHVYAQRRPAASVGPGGAGFTERIALPSGARVVSMNAVGDRLGRPCRDPGRAVDGLYRRSPQRRPARHRRIPVRSHPLAMIDHLSITTTDVDRAQVFYDAVMGALGYPRVLPPARSHRLRRAPARARTRRRASRSISVAAASCRTTGIGHSGPRARPPCGRSMPPR